MLTKEEKLINRTYRRSTAYEVVLHGPQNQQLLLGYTIHPSKMGMMRVVRNHGKRVVEITGITDDDRIRWQGKRTGLELLLTSLESLWYVRLGRTERDAIIEGEIEPI